MNSSSSILIHDVKKQRKTIDSYIQLEKSFANTKAQNNLTRKGAVKDPTNLLPHKHFMYNTPGNEYIDFLKNPYDRPSHCDSIPKFVPGYWSNREVRTSSFNPKTILKKAGWND